MQPRSMTHILLSIGLILVFSLAPSAVSSMGLQTPERGGGANGDKYADLAIGVPYRDVGGFNSAGMVGFAPGRSIGVNYDAGETFDFSTPGIFGEPHLNAQFGTALAGGDFNHDGYLDLAIGVPGETVNTATNAGVVTILFGSSSGYTGANSTYWIQPYLGTATAETSDRFGAALASGDFNGDGYDDLAVGVPGQDIGGVESAGVVNVIYNAASGTDTDQWQVVFQGYEIQDVPEEVDNFGSVLTTGDFDGDSYDDLAIGVPNEDIVVGATTYVDAGAVQIVYGSPTGLISTGNQLFYQGHDGLQDDLTNYDRFGFALAAGNFDGGRYDDLAIGVPYEHRLSIDDGIVQIVWGDVGGLERGDRSADLAGNDHGTDQRGGRVIRFCAGGGRFQRQRSRRSGSRRAGTGWGDLRGRGQGARAVWPILEHCDIFHQGESKPGGGREIRLCAGDRGYRRGRV